VARPRLKKRLKPRSADTARSRSVGPRLARDTGDIAKMARKYKVSIDTPDGSGTCSRSPCTASEVRNRWSLASVDTTHTQAL
jgi:hypothetical protein